MQIIWNGCDNYIATESLGADDQFAKNKDGTISLFKGSKEFKSFRVQKVPMADVPKDEDGDLDLDGLFYVGGTVYRAL